MYALRERLRFPKNGPLKTWPPEDPWAPEDLVPRWPRLVREGGPPADQLNRSPETTDQTNQPSPPNQ